MYEHKAALIGQSPAAVSTSSDLLVAALKAEEELYQADFITVGVDVYNVEAEALGAVPSITNRTSCPEIREPLWSLDALPSEMEPPPVPHAGRFTLLLEAAGRFRDHLWRSHAQSGRRPQVRVAASGPVSMAAKLVGAEDLLVGLITGEPAVSRLLELTTTICERWITVIRNAGHDAIIFDSSAAPPLVSPMLYATVVAPLHARLMRALELLGQGERPLIVGGDTSPIVGRLCAAGTNSIICDYAAPAEPFAAGLSILPTDLKGRMIVRCNYDPRNVTINVAGSTVEGFLARLQALDRVGATPVIGTGIVSYDLDPKALIATRDAIAGALGTRH